MTSFCKCIERVTVQLGGDTTPICMVIYAREWKRLEEEIVTHHQ